MPSVEPIIVVLAESSVQPTAVCLGDMNPTSAPWRMARSPSP